MPAFDCHHTTGTAAIVHQLNLVGALWSVDGGNDGLRASGVSADHLDERATPGHATGRPLPLLLLHRRQKPLCEHRARPWLG